MTKSHPKGLYLLFVTEMAERFSYYGMRALFVLYLVAVFFNGGQASEIYGSYTGLVYLTPLLGGYIADRYWGNRRSIIFGGVIMAIGQFLMFASACTVKQSIFTEGGPIDPNVDNTLSLWLMFAGLAALIFGNGFFKPNISTMVGDLYLPTDKRKDSAFTIFYMGINTGALIAPLICGYLGNGDWTNPSAFKWGFFCAGVGMVLSMVVFILLKNRFLVTPDGLAIGLKPSESQLMHLKEMQEKEEDIEFRGHEATTEDIVKAEPKKKNHWWKAIVAVLFAVVLLVFFAYDAKDVNGVISAAIYSIFITLPIYIISDANLTSLDRRKIGVIYIVAVFVIFFWSAFEQAGSSLTLFAEKQCDRHIGSWEMPTTWFQSINPIVVVLFAPVMATLWEMLSKRHMEPSSPMKQALGLFLLALGYLVIAYATDGVDGGAKVSMWWLVALYFIHTIGELSLSPIGLSMVSKLAPAHLASLLMGVWFMSNATSNIFAGKLATLLPGQDGVSKFFMGIEISSLSQFFMLFAVMSGVAALALFLLCPLINKMVKEL
jgi:POT family proton-dependent oligopeptide transporter